jgi:hypothetical protein
MALGRNERTGRAWPGKRNNGSGSELKGTPAVCRPRAWIDPPKIRDFALNPEKGDKALGFAPKLGLHRQDWRYLHDQIVERLPYSDLAKINLDTKTKWPEFTVYIEVDGHGGRRALVCTGWMVDARCEPWLTTLHVV